MSFESCDIEPCRIQQLLKERGMCFLSTILGFFFDALIEGKGVCLLGLVVTCGKITVSKVYMETHQKGFTCNRGKYATTYTMSVFHWQSDGWLEGRGEMGKCMAVLSKPYLYKFFWGQRCICWVLYYFNPPKIDEMFLFVAVFKR